MTSVGSRRVVANISLSLDGRINGPGGDYDMSWIVPHAITDAARAHMIRVTAPATTALLGRKNFEGFGGYWPSVAGDEHAAAADRQFSAWLNQVDKVVFSSTLTETSWANARIVADEPAAEVARLRAEPGGDIIVLSSSSIIRALLAADQVDQLGITLCPSIAGGGAHLFANGLPASGWSLADCTPTESGALCLLYDRAR